MLVNFMAARMTEYVVEKNVVEGELEDPVLKDGRKTNVVVEKGCDDGTCGERFGYPKVRSWSLYKSVAA